MTSVRSGILIVEDQMLLAVSLSRALQAAGYDTLAVCGTVEDALKTLEGATPQAAILDVNLGSGSTSEPIAEILSECDVPFAFLTAYGRDFPIVQRFPDAPCELKPISERSLLDLMHVLDAKSAARV